MIIQNAVNCYPILRNLSNHDLSKVKSFIILDSLRDILIVTTDNQLYGYFGIRPFFENELEDDRDLSRVSNYLLETYRTQYRRVTSLAGILFESICNQLMNNGSIRSNRKGLDNRLTGAEKSKNRKQSKSNFKSSIARLAQIDEFVEIIFFELNHILMLTNSGQLYRFEFDEETDLMTIRGDCKIFTEDPYKLIRIFPENDQAKLDTETDQDKQNNKSSSSLKFISIKTNRLTNRLTLLTECGKLFEMVDCNAAPKRVQGLFSSLVCKQICSGANHWLVLTDTGEVYGWGNNLQQQLGSNIHDSILIENPVPVQLPQSILSSSRVKSIACGHEHSLLLTEDGNVFGFGANQYGQSGIRFDTKIESPKIKCRTIPGRQFGSIGAYDNLSIGISLDDRHCYVWGHVLYCKQSETIRRPFRTEFRNIEDTIAFYSMRRNTPGLIVIDRPDSVADDNRQSSSMAEIYHGGIDHSYTSASQKLAKSFNDPSSGDLRFVVSGGEPIYVHRTLLQTISPYFERFVSDTWLRTDTVILESFSYEVYYAFLYFQYYDCLPKNFGTTFVVSGSESLFELYNLAVSYLDHSLQMVCVELLLNNVTIENCCRLFPLTTLNNHRDLQNKIVRFVSDNSCDVFKSIDFQELNETDSKQLVKSVRLESRIKRNNQQQSKQLKRKFESST